MSNVIETESKTALVGKLIEKSVLASPPDLLFKIINSLDSELSSQQIGEIVGHDQSVAAQVLKLSNSSFFGFKGEIKTLDRAINILGTKTVRNIAVTTLLFSHTNKVRLYNLETMDFWLHTFLVADITREICQRSGLDGDEGYIAGLLHHIGKLILYAQKQEPTGLFSQPHRNEDILRYESETWGVDSVDLTALLLKKWNIPAEIVDAIAQHKDPASGVPLAKIVFLADIFANVATDELILCDFSYGEFQRLLSEINLPEEKFNRFSLEIPDIVSRGKMIMKVLATKQMIKKKRHGGLAATLVANGKFSVAKCLLHLIGYSVEHITGKEAALGIVKEVELDDELPPPPAEKNKSLLRKLASALSGGRKTERVVEEVKEERVPVSWQPLVVFDGVTPVEIKRVGVTIYQIDRGELDEQSGELLPFFFADSNLRMK